MRTIDLTNAVHDWPKLKFCAYRILRDYRRRDRPLRHPLGKFGITEFIEVLEAMPKKDRKHVYAEIGSTFAITLSGAPTCNTVLRRPDRSTPSPTRNASVFGSV